MTIPSNLKTPGFYSDVDTSAQRVGLPANNQRLLFVTHDNKAGMTQPVAIYDQSTADEATVANSVAGRMMKAALQTNQFLNVEVMCNVVDSNTSNPSNPSDPTNVVAPDSIDLFDEHSLSAAEPINTTIAKAFSVTWANANPYVLGASSSDYFDLGINEYTLKFDVLVNNAKVAELHNHYVNLTDGPDVSDWLFTNTVSSSFTFAVGDILIIRAQDETMAHHYSGSFSPLHLSVTNL